MSEIVMTQMIGRAGRPQFDDSAQAIILTTKDKQVFPSNPMIYLTAVYISCIRIRNDCFLSELHILHLLLLIYNCIEFRIISVSVRLILILVMDSHYLGTTPLARNQCLL